MNQSPSTHELINDELRRPIERLVSEHIQRIWTVVQFQDLIDLASHPCGILSDGKYSVFAKLSHTKNGLHQFEVELDGLLVLNRHAGVNIPTPIGILDTEAGVLLVMEAASAVERKEREWMEIGRTLARIHTVKGSAFGYEHQGYFGPIYQDNRLLPDWLEFFRERRMWPSLTFAINSGNISTTTINQVEQIIERLPRLDIPTCQPSLLHGDAQKNNYISTADGALVIDPAIFYGHPEYDLAHLELFEPVPPEVFRGYQETLPIDPGFKDRQELWRIPAWLLCVGLEGDAYLPQLLAALKKYI